MRWKARAILSGGVVRSSSLRPERSNRQSSIFSALAEKIAIGAAPVPCRAKLNARALHDLHQNSITQMIPASGAKRQAEHAARPRCPRPEVRPPFPLLTPP